MNNHWFFSLFDETFNTNKLAFKEKDGNFILEIEVPGFNKDNLKIEVEDNILSIEGKNEERSSEFSKKYKLAKSVEKVEASIKDGILSITIIESKSQPVQVKIV